MAIWASEIKELEKLYESFKGQLPDLEKELDRLIKLMMRTRFSCIRGDALRLLLLICVNVN
jgi:hypothetical protein